MQVVTTDVINVKHMGAFDLARLIQRNHQCEHGDPRMVEAGMKEMQGRAKAYSQLPTPHDPKCRWGD